MIAIVILILFILLVLTTPWRRLSAPARLWALVACSNALVFFGMPTTPATSPWRPIVGRVLATCYHKSVKSYESCPQTKYCDQDPPASRKREHRGARSHAVARGDSCPRTDLR